MCICSASCWPSATCPHTVWWSGRAAQASSRWCLTRRVRRCDPVMRKVENLAATRRAG
uniref:Uncharacterized protein n=1 Tax=Setaria viridis TaxID=4556 RepID=A0A4U6W1Q3_SETVI|nr:hypothetical protein SEVIR_2G426850v2 [Setaria viridis]